MVCLLNWNSVSTILNSSDYSQPKLVPQVSKVYFFTVKDLLAHLHKFVNDFYSYPHQPYKLQTCKGSLKHSEILCGQSCKAILN